MSGDLILYTHPMSRGRMARWILEEVGAPYETVVVAYGSPMKAPSYRALNPLGKVPTIVHRGVAIPECAAIITYLADAFPEAGLAPALDSVDRGRFLRWMFFGAGPLEGAVTATALGVVVPPEKRRMPGWGSLADVLDAIDGQLSTATYLLGEHVSAADIYIGAQLGYGMMFGIIEKRPSFVTYVARLNARPAAIRARDLDDALAADHPIQG